MTHYENHRSRLTSRRSQPPLALAVPLSRFTSRVGGGSAFYVRQHDKLMKILAILFMCCGTLYAADSTNMPRVVIGPPRHIVTGNGDVGQFILQTTIRFGATPITTNGLPSITTQAAQWDYADDPGGIVIKLKHQELPAAVSFLHQAFGQPTWQHNDTSGYYQLTTNGCSIYFTAEHGGPYITINRPNAEVDSR
jgi:hypothetical protein